MERMEREMIVIILEGCEFSTMRASHVLIFCTSASDFWHCEKNEIWLENVNFRLWLISKFIKQSNDSSLRQEPMRRDAMKPDSVRKIQLKY